MSKQKEIRDADGFAVVTRKIPHKMKGQSCTSTGFLSELAYTEYPNLNESNSDKECNMSRERRGHNISQSDYQRVCKERDDYRAMCFKQSDAIAKLTDRISELKELLKDQAATIDRMRLQMEDDSGCTILSGRLIEDDDDEDDDDSVWENEVGMRISASEGPTFYGGPDRETKSFSDLFKFPKFGGIEVGFDPEHGFRFGIKTK